MSTTFESPNSNLIKACDATDKFIREYSDKMRSPVSQLLTLVDRSGNEMRPSDLDAMSRLLKDIDQILMNLMKDLERGGTEDSIS